MANYLDFYVSKARCLSVGTKGICALFACLLVAGCSTIGKSYSEINPERAREDVRKSNGYETLSKPTAGAARLVMRPEGGTAPVQFSISASANACEAFSAPEFAKYSGQGVVYPWIAKMTAMGSKGFVEKSLTPSQPVQVRAYASWTDGTPLGVLLPHRCGPLVQRFTPLANRSYVAKLWFAGDDCNLTIQDSTVRDSPETVESETLACPAR